MGLFGRNATTVGLDIGSGLIKLVAISHASGGPVLTKVAFASVVNDAIVEGEVMDPGIISEAIKDLMGSAGIKAKKVVTAVGGRDVIIKKISMDRMKEAEAREVIRWEAEQHVPFDMDNVELDFQILDPEGEGLHVLLVLRVESGRAHRDAARQATAPLDAEEVVADPGHCHGPPRELRFEWLKPGEEPMPTTHSSVCLAVYRNWRRSSMRPGKRRLAAAR